MVVQLVIGSEGELASRNDERGGLTTKSLTTGGRSLRSIGNGDEHVVSLSGGSLLEIGGVVGSELTDSGGSVAVNDGLAHTLAMRGMSAEIEGGCVRQAGSLQVGVAVLNTEGIGNEDPTGSLGDASVNVRRHGRRVGSGVEPLGVVAIGDNKPGRPLQVGGELDEVKGGGKEQAGPFLLRVMLPEVTVAFDNGVMSSLRRRSVSVGNKSGADDDTERSLTVDVTLVGVRGGWVWYTEAAGGVSRSPTGDGKAASPVTVVWRVLFAVAVEMTGAGTEFVAPVFWHAKTGAVFLAARYSIVVALLDGGKHDDDECRGVAPSSQPARAGWHCASASSLTKAGEGTRQH